jgi:autotransporter-associated beta strand protein
VVALTLLAHPLLGNAQTYNWTGGAGFGSWSNPFNWQEGVPVSGTGTALVFNNAANLNSFVDIGNFTLNSLTFGPLSGAFVLSGNPLQFTGATPTLTQNAPLTVSIANALLFDTAGTLSVGNGGTLNLSGVLSASSGAAITKTGAGTLNLSGTNNFGGGLLINQGTVQASKIGALGEANGSVTIASGATLNANYAVNQDTIDRLSSSSTGLFNLGADTSGLLNFASAGLGGIRVGALGRVYYTGQMTAADGMYRFGGNGTLVFGTSNALFGTAGVDINSGTVVFDGFQSYDGATTVTGGGSLVVNSFFGSAAPVLVSGAGSNIRLNVGIFDAGTNFTLADGGSAIIGYAADQGLINRFTATSSGTILLATDTLYSLDLATPNLANVRLGAVGSVRLDGGILAPSGVYRLGSGSGTLTLARDNALQNATSLDIEGTVVLAGRNSTNNGQVVVRNGATLELRQRESLFGLAFDGVNLQAGGTLLTDYAETDSFTLSRLNPASAGTLLLGANQTGVVNLRAHGLTDLRLGAAGTVSFTNGQLVAAGNQYRFAGDGTLNFGSGVLGDYFGVTALNMNGGTVVLNGTQGYTGATTITGGGSLVMNSTPTTSAYSVTGADASIRFNNPVPSGTANITLTDGASLIVGYAANQDLIRRITQNSVGSLLLAADTNNSLNFGPNGGGNWTGLRLGAIGTVNFGGLLSAAGSPITSPNGTYKLGGGGGTLIFAPFSLRGAGLDVAGPGKVILLGGQNQGETTLIRSGGTLQIDTPGILDDASGLGRYAIGNVQIDAGGTLIVDGTFSNQTAFLNRINRNSGGLIAFGKNQNTTLNLRTNSQNSLRLGAFGDVTYAGQIVAAAGTYRFGGDGTLNLASGVLGDFNSVVTGARR